MVFKGVFPYPPMFKELADELAFLRSKMSKDVYKKGTDKYRGEREQEISSRGIIGELIARDYLSLRPVRYSAAKLVDFKPLVEPDIIMQTDIGMAKIDVKCSKIEATSFMINQSAHENEKKQMDFYWFVKLEPNFEASHYLVKDTEVTQDWKIKEMPYTNVYIKEIPIL